MWIEIKGIAMAEEICRKYRRDGRLFELALITGLDCPSFIESFMNSKTARYWHYYTGEYSHEIYKMADAKTMSECWLGFHTLDVKMVIDDLKEIYKQERKERNPS